MKRAAKAVVVFMMFFGLIAATRLAHVCLECYAGVSYLTFIEQILRESAANGEETTAALELQTRNETPTKESHGVVRRFFKDNSGLLLPVALIALWLSACMVSRCAGHLFRSLRNFFIAKPEGLSTLSAEESLQR